MAALLRQLVELCLLRRGPQDLPYSPSATWGLLGGLLMLQAALGAGQGLEAGALAIRAGLTLLFTAGLARALLAARGLAHRAEQTVLALAGSNLLFVLASLPVLFSIAGQVAEGDLSGPALPIALLAIVLFLWKLRVEAAIWRHALDVPALPALALAVSLVLGEAMLVVLLVPVPEVSAAAAS